MYPTTLISEIQHNNLNFTKRDEIAKVLNSHFNEVGTNLAKDMPQSSRMPESYLTFSNTEFNMQNVSITIVYKLLSTIKTSKSAGHDRISGTLLRDVAL